MKRSEVFVFITILLIVASIIYRAAHFTEELDPLISWPLGGLLAGTLTSAFWLWRKKNLSARNVIGFSVMFTVIFFGLGFIDIAKTSNQQIVEAQKWPEIPATITAIEIYEQYPGKIRNPSGRWAPTWSYTYQIQDQKIVSHSMSAPYVHLLDLHQTKEKAESAGKVRPVGAIVNARYNPQSIGESVLDQRKDGYSDIILSLGVLIMLIGIGGLYAVVGIIRRK